MNRLRPHTPVISGATLGLRDRWRRHGLSMIHVVHTVFVDPMGLQMRPGALEVISDRRRGGTFR
jgi:hypothetical protein